MQMQKRISTNFIAEESYQGGNQTEKSHQGGNQAENATSRHRPLQRDHYWRCCPLQALWIGRRLRLPVRHGTKGVRQVRRHRGGDPAQGRGRNALLCIPAQGMRWSTKVLWTGVSIP